MIGTRIRKGLELHTWKGIVAALSVSRPLYSKAVAQGERMRAARSRLNARQVQIALAVCSWMLGALAGYWWFAP